MLVATGPETTLDICFGAVSKWEAGDRRWGEVTPEEFGL